MFGKRFLIVVVAALLLATFVAPAAAAPSTAVEAGPVQAMTWSTPGDSLSIFPSGGFQPNGGCETGGNCSL